MLHTCWPEQVLQHTEMTYLDRFPSYICFFARHPAVSGGRTAVGDNAAVTRALLTGGSHSWLGEKLQRLGVSYCRHLACAASQNVDTDRPACRSWQDIFGTSCKLQAEMQANNDHSDLRWLDCGGALWCSKHAAFARDITQTTECSHRNPAAFMCQLYAMHLAGNSLAGTRHSSRLTELAEAGLLPYHTRWGDGSAFSAYEIGGFAALHNPTEVLDLVPAPQQQRNIFLVETNLTTRIANRTVQRSLLRINICACDRISESPSQQLLVFSNDLNVLWGQEAGDLVVLNNFRCAPLDTSLDPLPLLSSYLSNQPRGTGGAMAGHRTMRRMSGTCGSQ